MARKFHVKHLEIYIIVFIAALVTAVVAITLTFVEMRKQEVVKGYVTIGIKKNEEVPLYGYNYRFEYYIEGYTTERLNKSDEISLAYSSRLAFLYASLDEETTYTNYPSIALLNKNPNQVVTLSQFTYRTLQDAYNKSISSINYSIFSEPLFVIWDELIYGSEEVRESSDPLYSVETESLLLELATYQHDRSHVDIEFLEDNKAKLVISEEYQNFLRENQLDKTIIGLNNLKTSYISKDIVEYLKTIGYKNGYLYTDDGSVIQLDENNTHLGYNYYVANVNMEEESHPLVYEKAAEVKLDPYSFIKSNRRFMLNNNDASYYLVKDGVAYYRSNYIDIDTGLPHNEVLLTNVYSNNTEESIVDLAYINNELAAFSTIEEIHDYLQTINTTGLKIIVGLNNNEKKIYVTNSIKDYISLSQELDYNLITI